LNAKRSIVKTGKKCIIEAGELSRNTRNKKQYFSDIPQRLLEKAKTMKVTFDDFWNK